MDFVDTIISRRSVRRYQSKPVAEEWIERLLAAAMSAPSARNSQPWHFVVLTDHELLRRASTINAHAGMAAEAPLAILVCAEPELEKSPGYWMLDCAAAVENLLLAAHGLGLGAVWTGVYPRQERIAGFRRLLRLPEEVVPHSMIVVGHPAEHPAHEDRFRPDRVHRNGW